MDGLLDRRTQLAQGLLSNPEMAQMGPATPQGDSLTQGLLAMFGGYLPLLGLNAGQRAGFLPGGDIAGYGGDLYEQITKPGKTTAARGVQAATTALGLVPFLHPAAQKWAANALVDIAGVEKGRYFAPGFGLASQMDVYHGSPHKWAPEPNFPAGRPRLDKIGTGEGAQAYGHGVYFAESPGVAKSYAESLAKQGKDWRTAKDITESVIKGDAERLQFLEQKGTWKPSELSAMKEIAADPNYAKLTGKEREQAFWNMWDKKTRKGEIYNLDLPDEQLPNLLDWDKPLSQQPEAARKAMSPETLGLEMRKAGDWYGYHFPNGGGWAGPAMKSEEAAIREYWKTPANVVHNNMGAWLGGNDAVAEKLAQQGIPGLSYLDAASRGAGEGTKNFVIWDQGLLDEMGRRMAKQQGLLPENIPVELPSFAPAARMAQWRAARANAALPVEQGGLGLGPANTAAERAKAQGFTTEAYHGTDADIDAFDINKMYSGEGGSHGGSGFYFAETPENASSYGLLAAEKGQPGNVMPVVLDIKNPMPIAWREGEVTGGKPLTRKQVKQIILSAPNIRSAEDSPLLNWGDFPYEGFDKVLNDAIKGYAGTGNLAALRNDFFGDNHSAWLSSLQKATGHDSAIQITGKNVANYVAWKPEQVRSRFAAFDPMRRNEADLLASWLLPVLFGGGVAGSGLFGQPQVD